MFNIEKGIIHTAYQLTVRPATVIGGYLAGRTVQYANPAGYLLVSVAVFVLFSRLISGPTGAADSDRFFMLLVIPFVAAAARALFWRGRFNYAEHLIAVMYLTAHVVIGLGVLYIAVPLISSSFATTYAVGAITLGVVYFAWAYSRLFPRQPWLAAVGALGALVLGAASWLVVLAWVVALFRNAFGR